MKAYFELASDYLVMASTLLRLNLNLLPIDNEADDEEDPRANLIKNTSSIRNINVSEQPNLLQEIIVIFMLFLMPLMQVQ